jgi:hypothetical protein
MNNDLLKIHDTYRKVDGMLVHYDKHLSKTKIYGEMIDYSRDNGHEYHKYHRFSEHDIHEIVQIILRKY